jgi:hypothetical protein
MTIRITMPWLAQRQKIKHYFKRYTVVFSKYHDPGILIKTYTDKKGKRYARVEFTNKHIPNVNNIGGAKTVLKGLIDIPAQNVLQFKKRPSAFERDMKALLLKLKKNDKH